MTDYGYSFFILIMVIVILMLSNPNFKSCQCGAFGNFIFKVVSSLGMKMCPFYRENFVVQLIENKPIKNIKFFF